MTMEMGTQLLQLVLKRFPKVRCRWCGERENRGGENICRDNRLAARAPCIPSPIGFQSAPNHLSHPEGLPAFSPDETFSKIKPW